MFSTYSGPARGRAPPSQSQDLTLGRIPLPNAAPAAPDWDVLCYDTETSGKDTKHGQVLQFSGIRADANLDPCQTYDHRSLRLPYVVPEVGAVRVTGYDLWERRRDRLVDEFDFARLVWDIMTPKQGRGRVFLTFNGVRYDDNILRTLFWRNLLDPYVTTDKACTRIDLYNLVRLACAMVGPRPIVVPTNPDTGRESWKLEHLAKANGIQINAHDGLADGFATIDIAHAIMRRAPLAWNAAFAGGNPTQAARTLMEAYEREEPVWLFTHFGSAELVPCLLLGAKGNGWLAADLRRSPDDVDPEAPMRALTYGRTAPLRVIRSTETPFLFPTERLDVFRVRPDVAEARANSILWSCTGDVRKDLLARYHEDAMSVPEDASSEERIYSGFAPWADKKRAREFHKADWDARSAVDFEDPRLADFAARIVLRQVRGMSAERASVLRARCAEALGRPYAPAESRFATLAREWPEADDEWRGWAAQAFDQVPASPAPAFA